MKAFWLQSRLTLKNSLDQSGYMPFFLRVSIYAWLNLIVIALILHPLPKGISLCSYLADLYLYFIPMLALGASVASYEIELFSGTGELLFFSGLTARLFTRILSIALEMIVPLCTFAVLFIVTGKSWQDWVTMFLLTVTFLWLGIGIGFLWGFRSEKSINNFCNAIVWVLGVGPGPFMGLDVKGYQMLYPGAQALRGDFVGEWFKLGTYMALAMFINWMANKPRTYRFFAK